ncbi:MAG: FAD-binding protein [Thermodesulfobacteriota bacterium]
MKLSGWGRYPVVDAKTKSFEAVEELSALLRETDECIVHAMGRSYGDSALNRQVIATRRFNKLVAFDPQSGVVTCESGVTLAELIHIFLPRGWFLSVTPGTRLISVGGAVAGDVHGKNHHKDGCFSACVESLELMVADGRVFSCSRTENRELFLATCGGMGLTGVILTVRLKLKPVKSAYIRESVIRCRNLAEVFAAFEQHRSTTYSVAWIDCLAGGFHKGRSVLMLGEHADTGRRRLPWTQRLTVPLDFPGSCLNRHTVRLFNGLYYRSRPAHVENRLVPLEPFFYPLDQVANWNRMYGRRGFTQYQLVLPLQSSFDGLTEILSRIAESGLGSFLAVLKLFGPENDNYLSFPMEGYTLALDFKIERRLFPFLDELDRIVLGHGGRLYLSKDVRMRPEVFLKGYPRYGRFAELRARYGMEKFSSLQSKRLGV